MAAYINSSNKKWIGDKYKAKRGRANTKKLKK
jgi:hypothetical protein